MKERKKDKLVLAIHKAMTPHLEMKSTKVLWVGEQFSWECLVSHLRTDPPWNNKIRQRKPSTGSKLMQMKSAFDFTSAGSGQPHCLIGVQVSFETGMGLHWSGIYNKNIEQIRINKCLGITQIQVFSPLPFSTTSPVLNRTETI